MAGYRTDASTSGKGVYVGLARQAVEELIASLRGELATLEAVHAMMCQDTELADASEAQPRDSKDMPTTPATGEVSSEDSAVDEDLSADESRPDADPRTLGPPRNGSMRDAILTLLCATQEAMSITDIAAAVRPGADATVRSSVGKTLNRMKLLGEVESVAPGMFRAVLSSRAA
ncbi:hypothetical protein ABZ682_30105 [Streptomyces griseoviridis]|uniref:hypothetical protein n=1 Tax=Streptomyces TaxID=1883 RepID=UPI0024730AB6|nr:hypothetical protein [Streptomyces sp. MAA16]MDH6696835.1 hypothetical protein [Streptomyces sp. MAA16]